MNRRRPHPQGLSGRLRASRATTFVRTLLLALPLALSATPTSAQAERGYRLATDQVYGRGVVTRDGQPKERDLLVDIYTPADEPDGRARPAVILVHGGAFHRGGRRQPPFREAGAVHSPMEDYARLLTPLGYVCFVVEYRLAPEYPIPSMSPDAPGLLRIDELITPAGLKRVNFARRMLGVPELAEEERILLWNAIMAAAEDLRAAVSFVRRNARTYDVDPEKIAMGGHSAGGGTTINAALGLKAPVAAIFPLSPGGVLFDVTRMRHASEVPPTLLVASQNDEPAILEGIPRLVRNLEAAQPSFEFVWVPGFGHFYPTGAVTLGDNGTRMSVGERLVEFLDDQLR